MLKEFLLIDKKCILFVVIIQWTKLRTISSTLFCSLSAILCHKNAFVDVPWS